MVKGYKTPNQADTLSLRIIFNTNFNAQTSIEAQEQPYWVLKIHKIAPPQSRDSK